MSVLGELNTNKSVHETMQDLEITFDKWGVTDWNAPRESQRNLLGPATVWLVLGGERKTLTCSRWPDYPRNLRALYITLDSLRLASQRGILEQYRQFFTALPEPEPTPPRHDDAASDDPWTVLGVQRGASPAVVDAAYRALAQTAHPDRGGSDEAMRRLNVARDAIRQQQAAAATRRP